MKTIALLLLVSIFCTSCASQGQYGLFGGQHNGGNAAMDAANAGAMHQHHHTPPPAPAPSF